MDKLLLHAALTTTMLCLLLGCTTTQTIEETQDTTNPPFYNFDMCMKACMEAKKKPPEDPEPWNEYIVDADCYKICSKFTYKSNRYYYLKKEKK